MSLTTIAGDRPVHFPAKADKFGFDAEVSRIFPDMARRAIPNFYESHRAHAEMLEPFLSKATTNTILDIGASRGAFFDALMAAYGDTVQFDMHAIDNSPDMCEMLRRDYPKANVMEMDITSADFLKGKEQYDIVCAHYVLQFVPQSMQDAVIRKVFAKVKKGGVLIYGHKSAHYGTLGEQAHQQYIDFRLANGYTLAEIEAKTKALKGSMFCTDHDILMDYVRRHFGEVQETFRFMMFSTFMAVNNAR